MEATSTIPMERGLQILHGPLPVEVRELIMEEIAKDYLASKRAVDIIGSFEQYKPSRLIVHRLWFERNLKLEIRGRHLFFNDTHGVLGRSLTLGNRVFANFMDFITTYDIRVKEITLSHMLPEWGHCVAPLIAQCDTIAYNYQIVPNDCYFTKGFECEEWYAKVRTMGMLSLEQAVKVSGDRRFTNLHQIAIYNNIYRETSSPNWLRLLEKGYELTLINTALYSGDIDPTIVPSLREVLNLHPQYTSQVRFNVLTPAYDPQDDFCMTSIPPAWVSILELNSSTDLRVFENCRQIHVGADRLNELTYMPRSVETIVIKPSTKGATMVPNWKWEIPSHIKSLQFIGLDQDVVETVMASIDWSKSKLIELRMQINRVGAEMHLTQLPETLECLDVTRLRNPSTKPITVHCSYTPPIRGMYKRTPLEIDLHDVKSDTHFSLFASSL